MTLPKVLLLIVACQLILPGLGALLLICAARLLEMLFWAS